MAAMINTSSSVKPRVVIFHIHTRHGRTVIELDSHTSAAWIAAESCPTHWSA
jgi:hypothetical protein